MSQQLRQLARHTSAGHLPTSHKRPPDESPDRYVQVRATWVRTETEAAEV